MGPTLDAPLPPNYSAPAAPAAPSEAGEQSETEDGQLQEDAGGGAQRTLGRTESIQSFTTQATAGSSTRTTPTLTTPRQPGRETAAIDVRAHATPGPSRIPTLAGRKRGPADDDLFLPQLHTSGTRAGDRGDDRIRNAARHNLGRPLPLTTSSRHTHRAHAERRATMIPPAHSDSQAAPGVTLDDLPPLLRQQTEDFLDHCSDLEKDNLIGAMEQGVVKGPRYTYTYPDGFWPEARTFLKRATFLRNFNPCGGEDQDHEMRDPEQTDPESGDESDNTFPPPPPDVQNFIVLPNAVPGGGKLTNKPFPLPRPHQHGAVKAQPPLEFPHAAEPDEGFPRIRRDDIEGPYAGWDADRIQHFTNVNPATSALARIHGARPIKAGAGWPSAKAIKDLIETMFGAKDVIVVPVEIQDPIPRSDPDNIHTRLPVNFGIENIPEEAQTYLTHIQTVSTPTITVHFHPTQLRADNYLGRIEGFTQNYQDAIPTFVRGKFESEEVCGIIRKYVARNPFRNEGGIDAAVQGILNSLIVEVETLPPDLQPIAHISVDSPADSVDGNRAWRKDLKTIKWKSAGNGTGLLIYLPPCRSCDSVRHRTEQCPFPDIQGWPGPTHDEVRRGVTIGERSGEPNYAGPPPGRGRGRGGFRRGGHTA